ncbi:unnamed protein product, partial [Didymodactylos carnosus]
METLLGHKEEIPGNEMLFEV